MSHELDLMKVDTWRTALGLLLIPPRLLMA